MNIRTIDPHKEIGAHEKYQLFWFDRFVNENNRTGYSYIKDFHITETLINQYNEMVTGLRKFHIDFPEFCAIKDEELETIKGYLSDATRHMNDNDALCVAMAVHHHCHIRQNTSKENIDYTMKRLSEVYKKIADQFVEKFYSDIRIAGKPVIWDITRHHDAYMMEKLELGEQMEIFVDRKFKAAGLDIGRFFDPEGQNHGETEKGIEIKHDMKSVETGNYYIELAETHKIYYSNNINPATGRPYEFTHDEDYVPSGILKDDNTKYFLVGVPEEYYIVRKEDLRQQITVMDDTFAGWQDGKRYASARGSKGVIFSKAKMREIAISNDIEKFAKDFIDNNVSEKPRTAYQKSSLNRLMNKFIPNERNRTNLDI